MPKKLNIQVPNRDCEYWDLTVVSKDENYAVPPSASNEVFNTPTSVTSPAVGTQQTLTHTGFSYSDSKLVMSNTVATIALGQPGQIVGTTKGMIRYTTTSVLTNIAPIGIGTEETYSIV